MSEGTITIEEIVSRTSDLPSIPAAALRLVRETESSEANAGSIGELLATDQALTVRVLRLANSPYYGLARRVNELGDAVVVLGLKTIKNLAMVASTYPWMIRPIPGYCLGPNELWTHAFATAVGSQQIAILSKKAREEVCFTAGLLHDVGKVALSVWIENKIQAILYYSQREEIPFDEAERRVLGFDHTQVGEHLCRQWNLPEDMCLAARYHHSPQKCETPNSVVDCVHVGNYLASCMGFGLGGDGLQYAFDESSLVRLGIKAEDLDQITDSFVDGYEKYEAMFQEVAA